MNPVLERTKRIVRVTAGVVIVVAGLALMLPGVPGPGFVVVFAGLSILALDFVWARRLKTKIEHTVKGAADRVRGREQEANREAGANH